MEYFKVIQLAVSDCLNSCSKYLYTLVEEEKKKKELGLIAATNTSTG